MGDSEREYRSLANKHAMYQLGRVLRGSAGFCGVLSGFFGVLGGSWGFCRVLRVLRGSQLKNPVDLENRTR
jgi:hypothetical protein